MVGSASSLRSFSPSIAADVGPARVLKGAASALVPRRIGWTSRAVRIRARAQAHHPGLMPTPAHPINNSTDSLSSGRPTSDLDPAPHTHAHAAAATTRAPSSSVPVLAITCGAVGGIIALAVVLALVYVRRIRRRVKSMKRRTNVLGPELAPMSPSRLSQLSTTDSPRVKFDGMRILPPGATSELTNHLPPLSAVSVSVSSPTSIELPGISPLSPIRTSTFILSPPPAGKRSTMRPSNTSPHSNPGSPNHSSRATVPWPLITALSLNDHPQYEHRNASSGTSGLSDA